MFFRKRARQRACEHQYEAVSVVHHGQGITSFRYNQTFAGNLRPKCKKCGKFQPYPSHIEIDNVGMNRHWDEPID